MLHQNESLIGDCEFLAMLAHDMKTPVKAQIMALKLLYSGAFGKLSKEACNLILNLLASNRYLQLVLENVLGNYRINKNDFILNKTKSDIRKTIEESIGNIQVLFEAKEQKIEVNYLADDFIKFYDEIEIQRVIINLLSNAFEYSEENSTINIEVNNIGKNLCVEIKSSAKINNKKRLEQKTSTGLGLKICRKIIEAHCGKIRQENRNGKFSVIFQLP